MNEIVKFFNFIGSLICHQLPSRTICAGGIPLPVCARCTGIYMGIFTGMVFILLLKRFDSDMPPGILLTIVLGVFMLPMVIDGVGSYLGIVAANNVTRLLTGAFCGLAIPFFLIPAANFKVFTRNKKVILRKPLELVCILAANALFCAAVIYGLLPYLLVSSIIAAAFLFTVGRIAYTVIVRSKPGVRHKLLAAAGATLCLLSILFCISAFVLEPLKVILIK